MATLNRKSVTLLALAISAISQSTLAQSPPALEEVFVTAQKRSQSLQDIGVAVTAFSGEQVKDLGMIQAVQLSAQTPNLSAKNAVGSTAPIFAIRGISLNDFASNGTQPVGVYVDEVYLANNSQLGFQLMDIERVEVLKGPQGTLYGRNTTAGAINFISKKPSEEFEAGVDFTAAEYDLLKLEAFVSGGFTDNLSGRFAAVVERQSDGFFTNLATGDHHGEIDRNSWRGLLSWDMNDNVNFLLNVHGGEDQSDNWYYSLSGTASTGSPESDAAAQDLLDARVGDGYHKGGFNTAPKLDNESLGGSLTVDWQLGDTNLISISAYDEMDYYREEEFDSTVITASENTYAGDLTQYSQELRLLGTSFDNWDWILGAFYGKDDLEENDVYTLTNHPIFFGTYFEVYDQKTTSAALYSHNEIQLGDAIKLTAGLRYTDEERSFVGGTVGLAEVDNKVSYDEVTGKLGLDYILNDDIMLYANYSRGYKSGGFTGFFTFVPEEKDPYEPEFIDAYELGFKSTLLDSSLQLNASAFFYEYTDLQRSGFNAEQGIFRIFNIDESEIMGAELELWWRPLIGLDVKFGAGYLDTEVTKSSLDEVPEGNQLANSPEWQFNAMVAYEWDIGGSLYGRVIVDGFWQDDVSYTSSDNPIQTQDAYGVVNGRIMLGSVGDEWSVSLWGKNLADEEYYSEIYDDGGIAPGFPAAPRTFGVTASKNW